ncbi:MAG TPA: hypothetical protein DEB74_18545 [Lachnospiraceae bacterium]|nr:hypothetical protein [Lachnospiraceae bacterium]
MFDKFEVGNRLAALRSGKGYSQENLAEKIGCSVITISRWENGNTHMKSQDVFELCSVLGVSADVLLGLESKDILYADMITELSEKQKKILYATMSAMISAMKS